MGWLKREGKVVYKKVNQSEAHRRNFFLTTVRWIDVSKVSRLESSTGLDLWSRNVVTEFYKANWFAGIPLLEALRLLVSRCVT